MRRHTRRWRLALLAAPLLAAPRVAGACAVCSVAQDDPASEAFMIATIMMSVLPLFLVGGFVWWLRRRTREVQAARQVIDRA